MLKPLLACLILAAPAAATAQTPAPSGRWTVSGSSAGCIAHSTSGQGTVVSILGAPGQDNLIFLVQNNNWSMLRDGGTYRLALELDGSREWEFDAIARTELDSDGPGFMFAVPPGAEFVTAFAAAGDMDLDSDGEPLDRLSLSGGGLALTKLAHCMTNLIADPEAGTADETILASGDARKI